MLDDCPALTRRALARQLAMTTARLNQLLTLLRLAPEIQREIVALDSGDHPFRERALYPLLKLADHTAQIERFGKFFRRA